MPLDITGESAYGRDWEGVAPLDLGRGETAEDKQMRYALSPSAPDAPDIELRTKATIITQHFTGRFDPHGRMWSGPDHGPMQPKAYYDKMMEYVRTGNPETLWSDEAKEYRKLQTDAERRDFAASHWRKKWDDYTDPLVDMAANATEAKAVENTLKDLQGISDTLDEQDAAFVASFMENRPSGEYHDDSEFSPTDSPMGMMPDADTMAKKRAAHLERVEYDRRLEELWSKNSKTIEKQKLVDKYEARLASENQWQSYLRIRNNLTDDEAQVLDMALSAGGKARTFLGSTMTPEVKEAFMSLPVESQRKVAPFLKDNAWRRDTTWVGDAVRGLARITGETIEDAGIGAAEYVRRIVVDGKEYQDGVERRALLRMANEGRMKEWGVAGDVLIDAIGNIGYMGLAAIPYAGTAMMMLSAGEQFEREAALAGADVSGWDMIGAKLAFSAAYAAVEGMQSHQIFGELTDFERRQLYANLTHHFNGKLWAKLGANVAIDTIHESIEEGIQNGIQESYVALGLGKPLPEAFCKGFVEDFMASLPSMLVTSGFGHGRRLAQYRNRPFSGPEEVLKQGIELEKVARATGERGSGAEGLAEIGRMMGFVFRDWRRAAAAAAEAGAGAAELRKAALMKYGLDEGQALQWDAMLTQIERNIGEDKAAVQAFYGTSRALTRSEIRQAGGMTETVDEATGARTLTFKDVFGTGTFSVELNAASGVDAEYAKTDEGVRSIVNALNDSRRKAPDGGAWTDENWRALPEADKQSILSEFRNPGLTTFKLATGGTVDNRFLAALEGKMQIADNAESGDVLGVAAFHEQGHVAGRMLALAARNGDEKARELVGKLAEKFGTAKLDSEAFDEEVFGDRFRDYLVGRFDVQDGRLVRKAGALDVAAEDETLFGQFVDWVRSMFSRADDAVRTRTRYDEFFEQAVSGDLEGAVAADEAAGGEGGTVQDLERAGGAGARASIRGLFTGSAADYDRPSLHYVGTGEGSYVYGWGLYASNQRGVAEAYADKVSIKSNHEREKRKNGSLISMPGENATDDEWFKYSVESETWNALDNARGNKQKALDLAAWRIFNASGDKNREKPEHIRLFNAVRNEIEKNADSYDVLRYAKNLYEQTFFTDRAPGDESHLLKWYEPVSDEQLDWIRAQAAKEGYDPADFTTESRERQRAASVFRAWSGELLEDSGRNVYNIIANRLGSPRAASEFLARAGIDGVKYPVDSFGGKGVKDGDKAGWNYVSFRDDNIRVDHKWVDGVQRYSIRGPSMSKMDAAVAFAARDAMTGRSREDADYQRLIDALGVGKMYTPQELRKAGEAVAAAARMQGEGKADTRSWRTLMKATGSRDVNRVADTATEQARRLASHPSDMETEAVREGIRRNPTLRELAKLAEAGRHVDDAIKAAYSFAERAGVEVATEAQKAEDEMRRAEEKLRQAEREAEKDQRQRDKLADLRADYQEKLRAYREKVAAKEAGERAMRQMLATQMRLHANAENVQDLDRVLGVQAVELMAQISEVLFSGSKAPGQVRGSSDADAATGESGNGGEATKSGAETAAPGPEVRVVGTVEEASQAEAEELHDKLVRVMAIMRDIREKQKAKAEEQARKRAEREEREEAEAKPVGNDEMEAEADEADEGEEDSGSEAKEGSEPEVIETVDAAADPEMVRAMLNALKTESLDLNTSKDFATYVLAFVMDSVQQSLNMEFDAVFRNTDPIVKVKFRKTLIDFLRATSDALLDPTDDAAAKLVERRIGDIKDDASVAQLWRAAAGILGVIQRRGIQQSRRRIMRDIDKYLKRMAGSGRKLDPLAPDLSRRMTARAVQDARWLRRVLKLSNGGVIAEQNKLQHTIEERQADGGDATDVQIDRAMRRMRLLEQFGGLRYMMPAEIKVAQHYIEDRFNAECMDLARRVEERKARTGAVADALIAAADATREALGGFDAEDGNGMSARGRRLLDSLAGGSLRQRLQHLTGDDPAARRAVDEIVRMVFEGETQHRLLEQRFKREHDAILQFAAEAGGIDQLTLLRQLDENVPDELSRALATPEQNRRLKWGQALQLLVSLEQTASYGDNIALHHREGHADLIREAMRDRPQFQALISKLRETYRDRRGMISEVMERVTGLPVLSPDPLFMPVRMKSAPREGLDMKVKSWTPWNAIFSPRVKNNLDFDTSADIMGMFDERSRETAKSVAFAEAGLDLRSILGRKETQTAFIRARGAFFNTRLIEQVTDALNSGYTTPSNDLINILRPLGTACTYASLSWNVLTMLKQMTSIPAWTAVMDGGYGELFKAMTSVDRKSIEEFMDAEGFRSRYGVEKGGWGTFAKIIGDAFRDPSRNYVQRFYDAGMTLVQFGDFVPSFLIGPGVYKARKAALMRQNPGMTEEAAKKQALSDAWSMVEQCQQSDLQENLPDLLRRQGVVAKQVMKFCNSPLMQVAHEVQSARMWADAARRAKAGEAGAQETADKWRARFVNQIVCNHIIMPAAMYAAELLVKAALGNEPPDKDEVMGRIVAQMLLGSWGKVFILGVILDKVTTGASVGAGKATGLYNYKPTAYMSSGGSPAGIQLVEQLVSDMGRLGSDIAYTDWESLRDDSVRMLARAARPVKYGVEATYNYGGVDRTKERAARRRAIRKEREKAGE